MVFGKAVISDLKFIKVPFDVGQNTCHFLPPAELVDGEDELPGVTVVDSKLVQVLHLNEIVLLCKELFTELLSCLTVPLLDRGVEVVCDNLCEELSPLHVVPGKTVHIWFVDFCSLEQSNW